MKLLFSAVVLGITGFDPLGIPIIIGALSANADKKAITTFTLTVLFGSVISGTFMSIFLGNNISFLANFFGLLPNYVWVVLNILLILGLSYWLIKRLTSENNKKKEIRTSSGWSQMDMFVTGLLFTLSAFPDPAFISLVVLCGHNGNLIVTIIAFIIWILISQFPIFLFNIAIINNCGEEFISKLETIRQKYSRLFEQIINTAIVIIILVFIFNLMSFYFTKTWMIKEDLNREYLKNDVYISAQTLASTIKYYLKKEKKLANIMDVDYFISLAETLAKMKNVRNTLAHELKSISREDFNRESETTIEQINSKILDFFNKFYTPLGYKKEMVEIYDNINKEIVKLLK